MKIFEEFLDEAKVFIRTQQTSTKSRSAYKKWEDSIDTFIQDTDKFHFVERKESGGCYMIHKTGKQYLVLTPDGKLISPGQAFHIRNCRLRLQGGETLDRKRFKILGIPEVAERYPQFFAE